jgi:hypothetical protein
VSRAFLMLHQSKGNFHIPRACPPNAAIIARTSVIAEMQAANSSMSPRSTLFNWTPAHFAAKPTRTIPTAAVVVVAGGRPKTIRCHRILPRRSSNTGSCFQNCLKQRRIHGNTTIWRIIVNSSGQCLSVSVEFNWVRM